MGKKILKALTNNLGFKLLAFIFAVVLWLVVYNVDDPVKTDSFTVKVSLKNKEAITDKYYEVVDNSNVVKVSVSAKRSVLEKLDDSDFSAVADAEDLIIDETGTRGTVRVDIYSSKFNSQLTYNGGTKYLTLSLEDSKSKQFAVEAGTIGAVADGYALGEVTISNSNVLKVSGPQSVVDRIARVVATINVEGMSQKVSDSVVPVLYDANGEEIDTTKLSFSTDTFMVTAMILNTKTVSLNFSVSNAPLGNYAVVGIVSNPSSVVVKGSSKALNPVSVIDIPPSVLDVSNATGTIETTINITEYLPTGIELVDSTTAAVSVTILIEPYETREFEIPSSNIAIEGLASEHELEFTQEPLVVSISGVASDLDLISGASIRGTLDVTDMTLGMHAAILDLDLNKDRFVVMMARVQIDIRLKNSDPPESIYDENGNLIYGPGDGTTGEGSQEGTEGGLPGDPNAEDTPVDNTLQGEQPPEGENTLV